MYGYARIYNQEGGADELGQINETLHIAENLSFGGRPNEDHRQIPTFETVNPTMPELTDTNSGIRIYRTFPTFTVLLLVATLLMFTLCDVTDCTEPLANWSLFYVFRHTLKTILYRKATVNVLANEPLSAALVWGISFVDFLGPTVWTMGGFYIFHTDSCGSAIYTYSTVLWVLQSLSLLLPCVFVSVIVFCAPCFLWLAPYIIRPNPNTVATSREVLARIPKFHFGSLVDPECVEASCSICLSEYINEDEVMRLPCYHIFHEKCISEWTFVSQLCPMCRENIVAGVQKLNDRDSNSIV